MNLKHLLGNVFRDTIDSACIFKGHRREIRKFKSPKRKAIYNTVTLSREQALAVDRMSIISPSCCTSPSSSVI